MSRSSHAMPSRIASTDSDVERSRSVSSIRRMNTPFDLRANAHGYSAERILPRWMKPVGLGAKRVRTGVCAEAVTMELAGRRMKCEDANYTFALRSRLDTCLDTWRVWIPVSPICRTPNALLYDVR